MNTEEKVAYLRGYANALNMALKNKPVTIRAKLAQTQKRLKTAKFVADQTAWINSR